MTDYMTEQEQIELLKNWLKEYGLVILLGLVIAVIGLSGWQWWQQRKITTLTHAASAYDAMLVSRSEHNNAVTLSQARQLRNDYPNSPYASMAALMAARVEILTGNDQRANDDFNWVIKYSSVDSFKEIARIRLAKLLISQHKESKAIDVLNEVSDKTFAPLIAETKGDAYINLQQPKNAYVWYQKALAQLPNAAYVRPLLQMKFDDLAQTQ